MASIIHFDISADDIQRAKHFYEQLFEWKIEKFPGSEVDYYLIETKTSTGEKGIGGGIAKREKKYQKITNFIEVSSIDESITKVIQLGGQLLEPKSTITNIGYIAACKDPEDNIFGIMELKK